MRERTASADLREEHKRILDVVGVLERTLEADRAPSELEAVDGCLEFFRLFTDACHHGKEEDVLFPELVEHGMSSEEGPIAVMLDEHRAGRRLVEEMSEALEAAKSGSDVWDRIETAGREYIDLIRAHIMKEDRVLFEVADRMVQGPACRRVCAAYHEVCGRRFEGRTHADLEALADRLLEVSPPPVR